MKHFSFQFFVHPRSRVADEKLTVLLSAHGVCTSSGGESVRSIEVDFTQYTPVYLVTEVLLTEISTQPYANEILVFYQVPGQRIKHLNGTAAKVTSRPLLVE